MSLIPALVLLQVLGAAPVDNGRLLRDARAAQSRFESARRMRLPRDQHGWYGRCDAVVGRWCYWYDSTQTKPIPEPRETADARLRFIAFLDSAVRKNPADTWLVGQHVRYLIEAGQKDRAVAVARACTAQGWWCTTLEGLALHVSQRYAEADSAFDVGLQRMPERQRCEWFDLRLVVADPIGDELSHANCPERITLANQLWLLGQPLWSTPGNDLRTEHFARLTMAGLLARAATTDGSRFGDDTRELLLRYGWDDWYTRRESEYGTLASAVITGHSREPSYSLFPTLSSLKSLPELTSEAWNLRERIVRSRYSPRHLASLASLPHQLARFPRGDSMLIAVALRVTDTALASDSMTAYFATIADWSHLQREATDSYDSRGARLTPRVAAFRGSVLSVKVANVPALASIEVLGERTHRAARARYRIEPLETVGPWALSDLLLFDPTKTDSSSGVEQVMAAARTNTYVSVRDPLGVLWEVQAPPGTHSAAVALTIQPVHVGVARRLAAHLHLASTPAPVVFHWQGTVTAPRHRGRMTLQLPENASGTYRVQLSVDVGETKILTAAREIEVRL